MSADTAPVDMGKAAIARSHYPPRPDEKIDWTQPLFDSDGYRHVLVELGGVEVVSKCSFAYVPWDRRTGVCRRENSDGLTLGNTPLSQAERDRRRAQAQAVLEDLHRKAAESAAGASPPAPVKSSYVGRRERYGR